MGLFNKKSNFGNMEKSEIAIEFNLRVSTPNGYFPDDVDRVIKSLKSQITTLEKDNQQLLARAESAEERANKAEAARTRMQIEMSLMEVPDTSHLADEVMLGRLDDIRGNPVTETFNDPDILEMDQTQELPSNPIEVSNPPVIEDTNKQLQDLEIQFTKPSNNVINEDGTLDILEL